MPGLKRPEVTGVDAVILHIVDPPGTNRRSAEEARGLELSQQPIPSDGDGAPAVFQYFQRHVKQALADKALRAARFSDLSGEEKKTREPAQAVREAIDELLVNDESLVAGSATLAHRLHDVMAPRGRISTGDLAVCLCRGRGGDGDWSRFVALLKIDPTEGFPQVVRGPAGKRYLTVELGGEAVEVLPTTRQRLQKAAFLRRTDDGGHDLLLLDLQTADLAGHVARFFAVDFLAAEVVPVGEIPQTQLVYRAILTARNTARPQIGRNEMQRHEDKVKKLLGEPEVDLDEVASVFTGRPRKDLKKVLEDSFEDVRLQLDPKFAKRMTRRRKFRGDDGLSVEASSDAWPGILQEETFVRNAAGPDYWRIVLHTETWEEVP